MILFSVNSSSFHIFPYFCIDRIFNALKNWIILNLHISVVFITFLDVFKFILFSNFYIWYIFLRSLIQKFFAHEVGLKDLSLVHLDFNSDVSKQILFSIFSFSGFSGFPLWLFLKSTVHRGKRYVVRVGKNP